MIKKLVKSGKHAELWPSKSSSHHNQNHKNNSIKVDKNPNNNNNKGQKQHQQQFAPNLISNGYDDDDDNDDYLDGDDGMDDDIMDDGVDGMQFLRGSQLGQQLGQLGLLKQQVNQKKDCAPPSSNNKINNNNVGKKGNPNQNMGVKVVNNPNGGIDQQKMAEALRFNLTGNNAPHLGASSGNVAGGGIGGAFNGNGYVNGHGLHQYPSSSPSPPMGIGIGTGGMTMNGFNNPSHHHPSSQMMMMNRQQHQQPPQMMYNRSPYGPPSTTGYYGNYSYNNCYNQIPPPLPAVGPYSYGGGDHTNSASTTAQMFSDDNTDGCSIM